MSCGVSNVNCPKGRPYGSSLELFWCKYLSNDDKKDDDELINKKRYKKNEKVSTCSNTGCVLQGSKGKQI